MIFLNKKIKRWTAILALISMVWVFFPLAASADKIEGRTVVTLGENLNDDQRKKMLQEMGVDEQTEIIFVSNKEEHQYLGKYISKDKIGTRAISSVKITLTPEGSGINVTTKNISWVTEAMFANALATAGVTDADVYVTAPFLVSGTAGLTGLLKAFEIAADIEISEEQKQVANEEMVRTAELGESIGQEEAAELMMRLKEALGNTTLETDEDYRNLIQQVASEIGVSLNEQDIQSLIHLLKRLKGLNINWDQVGKQLQNIRDNLDDFLNREDTRGMIRQFLDFIIALIDRVKTLFA
ncbi:DUF1002 domain-containing protein [Caldalkalibacillus mannanilyticus]|uniref:DUF1002 domain-containing protein n=1 Tax=Caldalkalibacillus mannanilyticus TaxID=1418 RepID=UPI00046891AC|nr:DUF1002 domain-containing protein [Caldalkalibacillus mannanilyticus]